MHTVITAAAVAAVGVASTVVSAGLAWAASAVIYERAYRRSCNTITVTRRVTRRERQGR